MARGAALAAAIAVSLLAVSGAGGAGAQMPKRGGTVVVAWTGPVQVPTCIFPRWTEPMCLNSLLDTELVDLVLARSSALHPEGWTPDLVSRFTTTRDPFTVTFHIHREARWSDGTPITAADWVFTMRTFLKYSGAPEDHPGRTEVRRFVAIDTKTLRVELRRPLGWWPAFMGSLLPLPRHVLPDDENPVGLWTDAIDNPYTGRLIGSGSFLLQRFRPGREVVLVRNPRSWGQHPAYLDRLVFRFGMNRADALRRGDVDVIGGGGGEAAAALEFVERSEPGIKVLSAPEAGWEHLDLRIGRGGHPALRNKLVRRALAYGIDREAIVRTLYSKTAPGAGVLDSTAFLANERGYQPNWSAYRYDRAKARRLLGQAGCRSGADGIYSCADERLQLRFVTRAGQPFRERALRLIQDQLREVGIEVVPLYAANFGFLAAGDFDVALFAWAKAPGERGNGPYVCGDQFNYTGYCSRLFNADLDQLERIIDPVRYAAVANRADRRLAQDVPVIPLYATRRFYAVRETIKGLRPGAFAGVWWNAEDWWLER